MKKRRNITKSAAVGEIEKAGILLVFPVNNASDPESLWSRFYPSKKMVWKWDESGDDRVGRLWMLMKELSDSREVVYSKWYRGRATFFSQEVFSALLRITEERGLPPLSVTARTLFECLEFDSPLSTKQLKKLTELQGKFHEGAYNRGMKELFTRLLIVGYGEVDDGAFPSLAVGTTKNLYEELYREAIDLPLEIAVARIEKYLPVGTAFRRFFDQSMGAQPKV